MSENKKKPAPKAKKVAKKVEEPKKNITPMPLATLASMVIGHRANITRWAEMNYKNEVRSGKAWMQLLVDETIISAEEAEAAIAKFNF